MKYFFSHLLLQIVDRGSEVKKRKRGFIERLTPLKKRKPKPEPETSPAKKLKISPTKKVRNPPPPQ